MRGKHEGEIRVFSRIPNSQLATLRRVGVALWRVVLNILKLILSGSSPAAVLSVPEERGPCAQSGALRIQGTALHYAAARSMPGFMAEAGTMQLGPKEGSCGATIYRKEPVFATVCSMIRFGMLSWPDPALRNSSGMVASHSSHATEGSVFQKENAGGISHEKLLREWSLLTRLTVARSEGDLRSHLQLTWSDSGNHDRCGPRRQTFRSTVRLFVRSQACPRRYGSAAAFHLLKNSRHCFRKTPLTESRSAMTRAR